MKQNSKWQRSLALSAAGLFVAASATLCPAADTIVVDMFTNASELNNWTELTGNGTLQVLNPGSEGSLKITLPAASGGTQVQPQVAMGSAAFNSALYWSVSFDIKVDPASGTAGDGTFGHWQVVARNSGGSWLGQNWTVLDSSYTTGWKHVEVGFVQPYETVASLVIQVQGGPYSGDLIFYLDNIVIHPLLYSMVIDAFTNANEVSAYSAWGASGSGVSWVSSPDAGGLTPAGSMKILGNYDGTVSGWSEATCQRDFSFDPSRFTYFDLDLYLDPASATPYGQMSVFLRQNHSPWNWLWIGGHNFSSADTGKWTHLSFPMAPSGETNASGFVVQTGGNGMLAPVISYVDNLKIWSPQVPPTITNFAKGGPGGVSVTMDQKGQQWQRDAIATPSTTTAYTWYNMNGVTYSFTITNFPNAAAHPGFDAHLYIVNEDTIPRQNPGWNETYGAVDWNAADIFVAQVKNNANGGVDFVLSYKTNLPNANVNNTITTIHAPSALGTWSVAFGADNTSITVTVPDGTMTTASLPQEVADRFNCAVSFLQFGAFKNDGANSGVNDGASVTFSRVQMAGGVNQFDDNFPGPGLTANYQWRTTSGSAVTWDPAGVGWWLTWTLPDDGFNAEVSSSLTGPWTDAGIVYKYTQGATRVGAVPAANIPAGDQAFFRLSKPAQ
jgi:hypothetical protein